MEECDRTIWCGNLSDRVSQDLLHELFLQAGPLQRVNIPKDRDGKQRSYGFITYVHQQSVEYAINIFKGTTLYDRPLRLESRTVSKTDRNNSFKDVDSCITRNSVSLMGSNDNLNSLPSLPRNFDKITDQMSIKIDDYQQQLYRNEDKNRMTNLSFASLTGQWSSKSFHSERFAPYKDDFKHNKHKNDEKSYDRNRSFKNFNNNKHYHDQRVNDYHRRREYDHKKGSRH